MGADLDPCADIYSPPPSGHQRRSTIRASDADRDAAAAALNQHFASGRLDKDEFSGRLGAVYAAKTHGGLDKLFADLPAPLPQHPRPTSTSGLAVASRRRHRSHFLPIMVLIALLGLLSNASHNGVGDLAAMFVAFVFLCCWLPWVAARAMRSNPVLRACRDAGRNWSSHHQSR